MVFRPCCTVRSRKEQRNNSSMGCVVLESTQVVFCWACVQNNKSLSFACEERMLRMKTTAIWILSVMVLALAVVSIGCQKGSGTGEGRMTGPATSVQAQENLSAPEQGTPSSQESRGLDSAAIPAERTQPRPSDTMVQPASPPAPSSPSQPEQGAASSEDDEGDVRLGRMVRGLFRAAQSAVPGVTTREESQTKTEEAPPFIPPQR